GGRSGFLHYARRLERSWNSQAESRSQPTGEFSEIRSNIFPPKGRAIERRQRLSCARLQRAQWAKRVKLARGLPHEILSKVASCEAGTGKASYRHAQCRSQGTADGMGSRTKDCAEAISLSLQ